MKCTRQPTRRLFSLGMLLALAVLLLLPGLNMEATAQCPMCRTSLEKSQEGQSLAQGINSGILFLLSVPFAVAGIIAAKIYVAHRRAPMLELELENAEEFIPGAEPGIPDAGSG